MAVRASADEDPSGDSLSQAIERAQLVRETIPPIIAHLVSADSGALFGEEIVARTAAMLASLARHIDHSDDRLTERLAGDPAIAGHCHALALEWVVSRRLEARSGLDPVLTPLLASSIAEERTAALVAAQARFAHEQRRMTLSPQALPAELFAACLRVGEEAGHEIAALRAGYDEASTREAVLGRFVAAQRENPALFVLEQSGPALFCTALAQATGCSREDAVILLDAGQTVRLATGLRAAGVSAEKAKAVFLALHDDMPPLPPLPDREQATAMMEGRG